MSSIRPVNINIARPDVKSGYHACCSLRHQLAFHRFASAGRGFHSQYMLVTPCSELTVPICLYPSTQIIAPKTTPIYHEHQSYFIRQFGVGIPFASHVSLHRRDLALSELREVSVPGGCLGAACVQPSDLYRGRGIDDIDIGNRPG